MLNLRIFLLLIERQNILNCVIDFFAFLILVFEGEKYSEVAGNISHVVNQHFILVLTSLFVFT